MRPKGLIQAYQLRDIAYTLASKAVKPGQFTDDDAEQAKAVTALIRAWAEADDHVRIHRGKPLPGQLRPVKMPRERRSNGKRVARPAESPIAAPEQAQDVPASVASVTPASPIADAPETTPATPTATPASTVQSATPAQGEQPASSAPSDDAPASPS